MQPELVIWVKGRNISEIQKCGAYREKTRVLVEDRSRRRNKQKIGHEEGEGTGRGEV